MKELQEKYKDDKQRLQAETMALYKQHGVNPLAGCLPMFLQMPIWIALYRMLSTRASCTSSRSSRAGSTTSPRPTRTTSCRSCWS